MLSIQFLVFHPCLLFHLILRITLPIIHKFLLELHWIYQLINLKYWVFQEHDIYFYLFFPLLYPRAKFICFPRVLSEFLDISHVSVITNGKLVSSHFRISRDLMLLKAIKIYIHICIYLSLLYLTESLYSHNSFSMDSPKFYGGMIIVSSVNNYHFDSFYCLLLLLIQYFFFLLMSQVGPAEHCCTIVVKGTLFGSWH